MRDPDDDECVMCGHTRYQHDADNGGPCHHMVGKWTECDCEDGVFPDDEEAA
jgi:hypothetical protein